MTILVTGGAGFIGANYVLSRLARSSESLVVVDALTYAGNLESLAPVEDNESFRFVKADIREELDRLKAHIEGARALLDEGGAIGRRLDFLCQEFNREANTLCSKSGDIELTRIGLAMKASIDQFREQALNVE